MRLQLQLVLLATVHLIVQLRAQTRELQEIAIESAAAKSWYQDDTTSGSKRYHPPNAHDGDYNSFYSVKDGDTSGNFLKLYLPQRYSIDHVKVTNRLDHCCQERITGTTVKVYSAVLDEVVGNCGTITDWNSHNRHDKDAQTYTLNCNGAVGDMIYITDTVIEGHNWDNGAVGHGISEVLVMGSIAEATPAESTTTPTTTTTPTDPKTYFPSEISSPSGKEVELQEIAEPLPGLKGEQGEPGDDGWPGDYGDEGVKGDDDYCDTEACTVEGEQGEKGDIGLPGEPGMKGVPFITGVKGIPGKRGQPGDPGENGYPGDEGYPGWKGEQGMVGADGVRVCNTGGCPGKRLRLGRCYSKSGTRSSVQCKEGYAANSIWRKTGFFGVKCCRILGTHIV